MNPQVHRCLTLSKGDLLSTAQKLLSHRGRFFLSFQDRPGGLHKMEMRGIGMIFTPQSTGNHVVFHQFRAVPVIGRRPIQ